MKTGTIFTATDKLGRSFKYRLDDINPSDSSREFKLFNLTDNSITEVEPEWFRQRQISIDSENGECEFCKDGKMIASGQGNFYLSSDGELIYDWDDGYLSRGEASLQIKFCPICGKELN